MDRRRGRGWVLAHLLSQFLRLLPAMVAHDIRPELDYFAANNRLGRDGKTASESTPDRAVVFRVVEVGNGRAHQVAHHIGIVGTPSTVITLAPYGAASRPED